MGFRMARWTCIRARLQFGKQYYKRIFTLATAQSWVVFFELKPKPLFGKPFNSRGQRVLRKGSDTELEMHHFWKTC
jgi:hypothetical protein